MARTEIQLLRGVRACPVAGESWSKKMRDILLLSASFGIFVCVTKEEHSL